MVHTKVFFLIPFWTGLYTFPLYRICLFIVKLNPPAARSAKPILQLSFSVGV